MRSQEIKGNAAYVNYHLLYKSVHCKSKINPTNSSTNLTLENCLIGNNSTIQFIFQVVCLGIVNRMSRLFTYNVDILCRNSISLPKEADV